MGRILLFRPADAPATIDEAFYTTLNDLALESNLVVVETGQILPADLTPETRLVVLTGEPGNLKELVDAAPRIRFFSLTSISLDDIPNLISLHTSALRPDQIDFLAGFIAATTTEHWRIGVISLENSTSQQAFTNGAVFFCGLCRPPIPPFEQYPLTATIPTSADWQSALDSLLAKGAELQTVYVAPGAESEALFNALSQNGLRVISTQPAPQGLSEHWIVSLIPTYPVAILKSMWSSLISADAATPVFPVSLFQNVNSAYFTIGRQRLAQELLLDLESGAVSTGIQ